MNRYFKKLAKTCQVKQLQYARIRNLDIFNHMSYVCSSHGVVICQKIENWEFAPMGKIRRKVQRCKSCHNVCFGLVS